MTAPSLQGSVPARRHRALAAIAIGLAAGLLAALLHGRAGFWPDSVYPWQAARLFDAGADPYRVLRGGAAEPFQTPLLYPFTTVLAMTPLARLPLAVAGGALMGVSAGALAWVLSAGGWWRLYALASAPFVMAVNNGQWSPLVLLAALVPACGWAATLKPNLGIAALAYRPTVRGAVTAAIALAASVAILPAWPGEWLSAVRSLPGHPSPLLALHGAGLVLLAGAIRWRAPEGRLLVILAAVPQLLFFADQLPLCLTARTRRELVFFSACTNAGFLGWYASLHEGTAYVPAAQPWVMGLVYLPALALVLRRGPAGDTIRWPSRTVRQGWPRRTHLGQSAE